MREDSFMKALFHGVIEDDLIFPYPEMDTDERETLSMIIDSLQKFVEAHIDVDRLD